MALAILFCIYRRVLTECSGRIVELQSYNQQGWPQTQDVLLYGLPAFQVRISHYDPDNTEAAPSFAGLICEALSCHNEQGSRVMMYGYDDLGRLVWAQKDEGDREEMQYDGNGNLKNNSAGNLNFSYNCSNLLTAIRRGITTEGS